MPDEPEALALLALLLLTDARRPARLDEAGRIVLLADQDRQRWDQAKIGEGAGALAAARQRSPVGLRGLNAMDGPYQPQAAIAWEHARTPDATTTDWAHIASCYASLAALTGSPVVELSRAVAVAMAEGPLAGLAVADGLLEGGTSDGYHHLHAPEPTFSAASGAGTRRRPFTGARLA